MNCGCQDAVQDCQRYRTRSGVFGLVKPAPLVEGHRQLLVRSGGCSILPGHLAYAEHGDAKLHQNVWYDGPSGMAASGIALTAAPRARRAADQDDGLL